jgi:hypothetical protein
VPIQNRIRTLFVFSEGPNRLSYKEGSLAMTTLECLPLWIRILDRMARFLPAEAEAQLEISVLRERLADVLAGDAGPMEDMESRLGDFARRHTILMAAATDETVGELFALVDPILTDLRRANAAGTLNAKDRAAAKGYIAMLDACGASHDGRLS